MANAAGRSDAKRLAVLALCAAALHGWIIARTEVAARDSVGFIRDALSLENPPDGSSRRDVVRRAEHPPGYPLWLLAVSYPVRALAGGTTADSMVLSAQVANALAGVLLIFPMYALGRLLFNRRTAFYAAALFQALPVAARVTSDGLSDGLYLLVATTTLWLAARALRRPDVGGFLLCGFTAGVGYLVRPEGVLLAGAVGLTVLFVLAARQWRLRTAAAAYAGLAAGLLLLAVPYVALTGQLSNKPTAHRVEQKLRRLLGLDAEDRKPASGGGKLLLAEWVLHPDGGSNDPGWRWAAATLGRETFKSFYYVPAGLALFGLCYFRRRLARDPAGGLLLVMAGVQSAALFTIAQVNDQAYISERHTLIIVLAGCFWAAAVLPVVGRWVAPAGGLAGRTWAALALAALVLAALPAAAKPLHANRAGHHAAGLWLAERAGPDDIIVDPFEWARFYAGRSFGPEKPRPGPVHYAVVEPGDKQRSCLPARDLAREIARSGVLVFQWPADVPPDRAKVQVYRTVMR